MRNIIRSQTKAVRASESRYRLLFNQIENIIIILDSDRTILQINPFGLSFLEKTGDEVIGRKIQDLNILPAETNGPFSRRESGPKQKFLKYIWTEERSLSVGVSSPWTPPKRNRRLFSVPVSG